VMLDVQKARLRTPNVSDTITPSKRLESAHRQISDDC